MKNNTVKKMIAITVAMSLMVPGYRVAAEEIISEEQVNEVVSIEETAEEIEEPEEEYVEEDIADSEVLCMEMAGEENAEQIIEPEEAESIVEVVASETVETESETEAETETESESETETEAETETEETAEFRFENEEVIIKADIDSEEELPENLKMVVKKLEEDSETFAMAKTASMNSLGTEEEAHYSFYEVTFEVDGEEFEIAEEDVMANVTFKNEASAMRITDGVATKL